MRLLAAAILGLLPIGGIAQVGGDISFRSMQEPYPSGISPLLQKSRGGYGKPMNLVLFGVILPNNHAGGRKGLAVIGSVHSVGDVYREGDNVGVPGVFLKEIARDYVILSREEGDVLLMLNR